MEDLLEKLNNLDLDGEFSLDGDKIHWYYSMDTTDDPDSDQDHLWSIYCDVVRDVRESLSAEFITCESWQDNDSCGFEIKHKQR